MDRNPSAGPAKFADPFVTAKGEPRARVSLRALETLWFNTGTLCNITCPRCYIESSPRNDRLAYLTLADVEGFLDEIARDRLATRLIGFTGGEPFMNPEIMPILETTLARGFETLVLTNAMKPMMRTWPALVDLAARFGSRLRVRVSLDDWRAEVHDAERGPGAFEAACAGLRALVAGGVWVEVAGRRFGDEPESEARAGFARMFTDLGVAVDADDPQALVLFPEMAPDADPPEITEACWGILDKQPCSVMCASARMVVRRRGAERPAVLACTLIPYDPAFELGETLADAAGAVALNHPYCASFCVLGGASCGASSA